MTVNILNENKNVCSIKLFTSLYVYAYKKSQAMMFRHLLPGQSNVENFPQPKRDNYTI